jgi:hypothetical protein
MDLKVRLRKPILIGAQSRILQNPFGSFKNDVRYQPLTTKQAVFFFFKVLHKEAASSRVILPP